MVIQDLQTFLESQVPGACVPVDLLKIAKSVSFRRGPQRGLRGGYGPGAPLTLVVDGECCLDRLYGGFFSDWVCGGQWNRMVQFLAVLIQTVQNNNIELAVFFNGALEQQRLNEWSKSQLELRKNVDSVLKHVNVKGTPPPKVWWVAPTGLRTCLRMALRHLNIQVLCTMDDHHQEVIAFCRENNYHGLMAEDAEYIIFDPPRYFSSHQLKLTYKGSLETKEFILDEVARGLGLSRNYFCLLAALMGNYLLTETHLRDFYATLIPGYEKQTTSQEEVIRAVVKFIVSRCDVNNLLTIGAHVFGSVSDPRVAKFKESVQYFLNGTKDGFLRYKPFSSGRRDAGPRHAAQHHQQHQSYSRNDNQEPQQSPTSSSEGGGEPGPQIDTTPVALPPVPHEVMRTASERHQKGLMCPWVYQVLTQGEVKFSICMEEDNREELPCAAHFYRPVRQNVYSILFNLHHHTFMARKAKEEGQKGDTTCIPEIKIREWVYTQNNPYHTAEVVEATPINWAVPTVQRLWFGSVVDDKKRRLRAFLSCMRSDTPLMLHISHVPQHLLIMATVLRYIMSSPSGPILRKQELDALLVTAFSPDLTNAHYLQDLQLPIVTGRGTQLASLFMFGVETALFANDACGAPVPWLMCCPWLYFDGKLFHSKLIRANCSRSLIEVCEGDIELVSKVERCRQAILESLRVEYAQPIMTPVPGVGMNNKLGGPPAPPMYPEGFVPPFSRGRGRLPLGNTRMNGLYSRGGQLQVAGVVVGSWGPNYGSLRSRVANSRTQAKRRIFRRKEPPRPPKGRGMTLEISGSRSVPVNGLTSLQNGGFSSDRSPSDLDPDCLSPYHPYDSAHSPSSSGLKSPDSGVNVSIHE